MRTSSRFRRAGGFTLVELMVAMLLGLIVIGGVFGVVLIMMQTARTNTALGEVQSGARTAFELLAHDIRNAQLTGCNNNQRVANALKQQDDPAAWWADWRGNAFIGHAGAQADPAAPFGTAAAQRVAGTDSITLLGAADTAMSVGAHDAATGQFAVHGSTGNLRDGDVAIVCDPDHAAIFQTSRVTADTSLTYDADHNCTAALGFPGICGGGARYTFGANSQIAPLAAAHWYVGISGASPPDGAWSLYRMTLDNVAGAPTPVAHEMVRGVAGMSLRYLQDGALLAADDPDIVWSKVTAVQVQLNLQSSFQHAGVDAQPLARGYTATVALYNRLD